MEKNTQSSYFLITFLENEIHFEHSYKEELVQYIEDGLSDKSFQISDFVESHRIDKYRIYNLVDGLPHNKKYMIIKGTVINPKPIEEIRKVKLDE